MRTQSLKETITLYTAAQTGTEDRYGNAALEESVGLEVPAMVTPSDMRTQGQPEVEVIAETRVSFYNVIVLADVTIDALARVEWRGRSFQVVGEPKRFVGRRGLHHSEFSMREVLGG